MKVIGRIDPKEIEIARDQLGGAYELCNRIGRKISDMTTPERRELGFIDDYSEVFAPVVSINTIYERITRLLPRYIKEGIEGEDIFVVIKEDGTVLLGTEEELSKEESCPEIK